MTATTDAEKRLQEAIRDVYNEWVAEHDLTQSLVVHSCVVVAGAGYDEEGNEVTLVQIVPNGPHYAMSGLLDEAATRFRAEMVSSLFDGSTRYDEED